ncbi:MAG: Asp-tRNA(Asn)/Glu-tRNA(Gln) amidotransferase GatCAB subunit B [Gammaproteobacteria bacterium]|mgnify:CR=1 FL=1|nr:Asp-tRNA(Asn)/Glu-tRNA(Gln) amidotransferase GatCAB subunit B [Gammaproteobacteria bacterium]|tara:strand:+ start:2184 stop:3623 length:1440 start_codon:yes stop_codon:yes gene_type:complete
MNTSWEVVIGLEIHVQLATKSKIFSGSSTAYGAEPNTQANLVDLGYPGVLPVLNEEVIRMAVLFGLAVNASVAPRSVFARKNYFYPDLPKGYQISQLELPIIESGKLHITGQDGTDKCIGITRAHLEEDAGKSIHENFETSSGIDLNRAGTPLLEIVSEPDLRSAKDAVTYLRKIHSIVHYLEISDGNMQEGSFRCDANVSVRPKGQKELGIRTELKNLNSFRFIERAINIEVERQIDLIEDNKEVIQETRLYDSDKDETRSMRSKEEANDYRYFPDPDLLPVEISNEYIEHIRVNMPELPNAKMLRFVANYELKSDDAAILTASRPLADYYERVVKSTKASTKVAANWVIGDLGGALNRDGLDINNSKVSSDDLAGLLNRINDETISQKIGKQVFDSMWNGDGSADEIISTKSLKQITDSDEIELVIIEVINKYPNQVEEYRAGKDKVLGFFVGKVMQKTKGKANPGQVNQILKDKLQ